MKTTFTEFLNEKNIENYTTFESIQSNPNIILNIVGDSLTLYDIAFLNTENPIDGVLGCIGMNENENVFYEVARVAGKKGFGKIMYMLGMEFASPLPIVMDREGDTREDALRVITKMKNNPIDIRVKSLTPDDENYISELDFASDEDEPEFFDILNTQFFSKSTKDLEFFKLNDRIKKDEKIDMYGRTFFDNMYW